MHSKCDSARLQAVQSQGWALVASLRSSSAVLYSVIPEIADSFDSMIGLTINSIQTETMDILTRHEFVHQQADLPTARLMDEIISISAMKGSYTCVFLKDALL